MRERQSRLFAKIKSRFVTLPGEELILVQRQHWSIFVFPILSAVLLGSIAFLASLFIYPLLPNLLPIILATLFLIFVFLATFLLRSIIDWYFNLYVVTNRKITEISYKPLAYRDTNEILLDQVKCTEIDSKIEGVINEILDLGNVIITFDRPTHTEEFVFQNIRDPKSIETYLHRILSPTPSYEDPSQRTEWYSRNKYNPKKWTYMEDSKAQILPKGGETVWNL